MRKRFLAGLLTVFMVLAMLPDRAEAYVTKTHTAESGKHQQVSLGTFLTAAIGNDGGLYICGNMFSSKMERYVPEETFQYVTTGMDSGAAITTSGKLYVWGSGLWIGNGETSDWQGPTLIPMPGNEKVSCITVSQNSQATYAAITESGALYTWGSSTFLQGISAGGTGTNTPQRLMPDRTFRSVCFGDYHAAAITTDGQLYTWGANKRGQLGNGAVATDNTITAPTLISIPGVTFTSVVLAGDHSAAISTNGELYMWGCNENGASGTGTTGDVLFPAKVMDNVQAVELTPFNGIALKDDGTVWAWGSPGSLLGGVSGSTTSPVRSPLQMYVPDGFLQKPLQDVVAIAMGGDSAAVVTSDGTLYGWGSNPGANASESRGKPVIVMEGTFFTQVFGGSQHMAALSGSGDLHIWGGNSFGEVGNGYKSGAVTPPFLALHTEASQPELCNHNWTEYRVLRDPTCTEPGSRGRNCILCGAVQFEATAAPLGHQWGEFEVTVPAVNCLQTGIRTRTCSRCGETEEETFQGPHSEFSGSSCADPTICFTCREVLRPAGQHDLTYAANGAVITETCTFDCGYVATATIVAADAYYTGKAIKTAMVITDPDWQGGELEIAYSNNVNPGTATASISIGGVTALVSFRVKSRINLKNYLLEDNSKPSSGNTMGGRRYLSGEYNKQTIKSQNKEEVVYSLTAISLANASAETAKVIRQQIYNLLYNATYKPLEMAENPGKDDKDYKDIIATWPIRNRDTSSTGPITDKGLDVTISLPIPCKGCYSYPLFGEKYVYGFAGKRTPIDTDTPNNEYAPATVIKAFHDYLDPGETIRYELGHTGHALIFLGESEDGQGFYFLSYDGGSSSSRDFIRLGYFSYENFTKVLNLNNYTLVLWDANRGSYYNKSADNVGLNSKTKTGKVLIECPVEVVVSLGREILDSRLLDDGETAQVSFGTMAVHGPIGGDRKIVIDFDEGYIDSDELDLKIFGTDNGTMTVTVAYVYTDPKIGNHEELTDIRVFKNIPITVNTTVYTNYLSEDTTTSLFVDDSTEDGIKIWDANNGETVTKFSSYAHEYDPIGDDDLMLDAPTYPLYPIFPPASNTSVSTKPEPPADLKIPDVPEESETQEMPEDPVTLPFTDVTSADWYYDAVRYVYEKSLMTGTGNNLFTPDSNLSRAQLAQILYNKEGKPAVDGVSSFTDVVAGAWYSDAVIWAAANNIVSGYGNGLFGPDDNITREQLAVMLWRYEGEPVSSFDLSFSDTSQISDFALPAIRWAVENGILNGKGNNILDPTGFATRAEVAQMFKNYLGNSNFLS